MSAVRTRCSGSQPAGGDKNPSCCRSALRGPFGLKSVGENRVQEACARRSPLGLLACAGSSSDICSRTRSGSRRKWLDRIQSVDSEKLILALQKEAAAYRENASDSAAGQRGRRPSQVRRRSAGCPKASGVRADATQPPCRRAHDDRTAERRSRHGQDGRFRHCASYVTRCAFEIRAAARGIVDGDEFRHGHRDCRGEHTGACRLGPVRSARINLGQ
jgi:hypothetical protein